MVLLNQWSLFAVRRTATALTLSLLLHVALVFFLVYRSDHMQQSLAGALPEAMSVTLIAAGSTPAMRQMESEPEDPVMVSEVETPDLALAEQGEYLQHSETVRQQEQKVKPVKVKPVKKKVVKPAPKPAKTPVPQVKQETVQTPPTEALPAATNSAAGDGGQDKISMRGGGGQPSATAANQAGNALNENYAGKLLAEIDRHKYYPPSAKRMDKQGTVNVGLTIQDDGRVTDVYVIKSSGSDLLDKAAVEAVSSARSVGPRPASMEMRQSLNIPFILLKNDDW